MQDKDFPALPFVEAGYHVLFRGEKSYNGVALVSRRRPSACAFGLDDGGPADETRLLYAKIGPIHVVNTYVPQGRDIRDPMYLYKLEWYQRLRKYFDRRFTPRMKLVWLGDMNVAPLAEDIHNADQQENHVCHHADVRKAFDDVMRWGFVDVFRKRHSGPGHYTFFDYRLRDAVGRNLGWRVDHILATPPLAKRSGACYIDLDPRRLEKPSDHTFLVAEFDV